MRRAAKGGFPRRVVGGSARVARRAQRNPRRSIGLLVALLAFALPLIVDIPGLDPAGERMLAVFLAAIVLFVTEAIPLVATGVLIILLEVLLISDAALSPLAEPAIEARDVYASLADPVIILFLGGFLIADGAAKYALDRNLAALILTPFKGSARQALLALMVLTAVLSMFMSNTATTATMFAVLLPVLAGLPTPAARTAFALAIPLAANVGGIGTPVGSPPNALALAALGARGETLSFLTWMIATVPLMLLLLGLGWVFLIRRFLPQDAPLDLSLSTNFNTRPAALIFYATAGLTVTLWLTEPLHGIPSTTVGFIPVVVLLATQVMSGDDLRALQWPVLWLVAGGIALGNGVAASGLDEWLVGLVDWSRLTGVVVLAALAALAWAMSNVISNSATANLLIPLALAMASSLEANPIVIALVVAVACSLAMVLPISTPPNAIAYATGAVRTPDLALVGVVVGLIGVGLLVVVMPWYWHLLGIG